MATAVHSLWGSRDIYVRFNRQYDLKITLRGEALNAPLSEETGDSLACLIGAVRGAVENHFQPTRLEMTGWGAFYDPKSGASKVILAPDAAKFFERCGGNYQGIKVGEEGVAQIAESRRVKLLESDVRRFEACGLETVRDALVAMQQEIASKQSREGEGESAVEPAAEISEEESEAIAVPAQPPKEPLASEESPSIAIESPVPAQPPKEPLASEESPSIAIDSRPLSSLERLFGGYDRKSIALRRDPEFQNTFLASLQWGDLLTPYGQSHILGFSESLADEEKARAHRALKELVRDPESEAEDARLMRQWLAKIAVARQNSAPEQPSSWWVLIFLEVLAQEDKTNLYQAVDRQINSLLHQSSFNTH